MSNNYEIRNERGILIAKLPPKDAGELINSIKGHWRSRTTKDGKTSSVYQIDQDIKVYQQNCALYVWSGYIVCQEN